MEDFVIASPPKLYSYFGLKRFAPVTYGHYASEEQVLRNIGEKIGLCRYAGCGWPE